MKMFFQRFSLPSPTTGARSAPSAACSASKRTLLCLLAAVLGNICPATQAAKADSPLEPHRLPMLAWDAKIKEYTAREGEAKALFTFNFTNISGSELVISNVSTTCGCTIAKLPSQPWFLTPGTNGQIEVAFDMKGKYGTVQKSITVHSSAGSESLTIKVIMPPRPVATGPRSSSLTNQAGSDPERERLREKVRNIELARADRQAVFKNDCATCHVEPAVGKQGKELYAAACGICHDAVHRAGMVPDLASVTNVPNRDYWMNWVAYGKEETLMPAFAQSEGGPLTKEQINSLVSYLVEYPLPKKTSPVAVSSP